MIREALLLLCAYGLLIMGAGFSISAVQEEDRRSGIWAFAFLAMGVLLARYG